LQIEAATTRSLVASVSSQYVRPPSFLIEKADDVRWRILLFKGS